MSGAKEKPTGLSLLREPFPAHQISKLPKATKQQTEAVKADFKLGIRCKLCGQWHHKDVVHLDYVGHAALTDRLLDCDPSWNWEPVSMAQDGTPLMDGNGGMWIRLTVCGVTRLGYGHPDGKRGGDAIKEVIGDALRNAAMRFGAALDLWHKGDLHGDDADEPAPQQQRGPSDAHQRTQDAAEKVAQDLVAHVRTKGLAARGDRWRAALDDLRKTAPDKAAWVDVEVQKLEQSATQADDDHIPY